MYFTQNLSSDYIAHMRELVYTCKLSVGEGKKGGYMGLDDQLA